MTARIIDLQLPPLPSLKHTFFEANCLSAVGLINDLTLLSDPYVRPVPAWWNAVALTGMSTGITPEMFENSWDLLGLFNNPASGGSLKGLRDDAFTQAISMFNLGTADQGPGDGRGSNIPNTQNAFERFAYRVSLAAEAARLTQAALAPRRRLSELPTDSGILQATTSALRNIAPDAGDKAIGLPTAYAPELEELATLFLTRSDLSGRGTIATGPLARALQAQLWAWSFQHVIPKAYLSDIDAVVKSPNPNRDDQLKRYIIPKRVLALFWRTAQELPLYILRSLASVLFTPAIEEHIRASDMANHLQVVKDTLQLPGHPLLLGISAWQTATRGQTPYGASAPRSVVEHATARAIQAQAALTKGDLRPVAQAFLRAAHSWALSMRTVPDGDIIALDALHTTLGYGRTATNLGVLTPPFGATTKLAYTTGDALSVSSLTLGDAASTIWLPAMTANASGARRPVGIGMGHIRLFTSADQAGAEPLDLISASALGAFDKAPYGYMEPIDPVALVAMPMGMVPLSAIKPFDTWAGSAGVEIILEDAKTAEDIAVVLANMLFGFEEGDVHALAAAQVAYEAAIGLRIARLKTVRSGGFLANPEALFTPSAITVETDAFGKARIKGKRADLAYWDEATRVQWRQKIPLAPFGDVWRLPSNGNGMMLIKGERLVADRTVYSYAVTLDPLTPTARADSAVVFSNLIRPLIPAVVSVTEG